MLFVLYFLFLSAYSVFSYIFTDLNLVLSTNSFYWNFQRKMWQWHSESDLLTILYAILILGMFLIYLRFLYSDYKRKVETSDFFWFILLILPLVFSYNALSYDIFNYLFNSKMVLVYGANPHVQTALDFGGDLWLRFMHNVHTPAPYGYGWTALSLIPGFLGFQKLIPSLLAFRLFNIFGLFLLYFALQHLSQTIYKKELSLQKIGILFLNPLFLIEVISNYHNDIWMLVPAIFSVSYLLRALSFSKNERKAQLKFFLFSLLLLFVSISIKLVTVTLLPVFFIVLFLLFFIDKLTYMLQKKITIPIPEFFISQGLRWVTQYLERFIPIILVFLLFIPLLTSRSQQFHPWYLTWILVWMPFIEVKIIRNTIILFSVSSLLRYIPWIYNGFEYSDQILQNQKLITWIIPTVYLFTNLRKTVSNLFKK